MAQAERIVHGSIAELKRFINEKLPVLGFTLTLEEELEGAVDDVGYWVAAFERYSMLGGNRLSLNVVALQGRDGVKVIATSTGASLGAFIKINTWSEDSFVEDFISIMDQYEQNNEC